MSIKPEDIFALYQRCKANYLKRYWRTPKRWDVIKKRKDWKYFEELAAKSDTNLALVDIEKFFIANLTLRQGRFVPAQFFQKISYVNYSRWLAMPEKDPDYIQVQKSISWLTNYFKINKVSLSEYFSCVKVYPPFLTHFAQGTLHKFILAYYFRTKPGQAILSMLPSDVIEHAISISKEELLASLDVWWMQLNNDERCYNLIEKYIKLIKSMVFEK